MNTTPQPRPNKRAQLIDHARTLGDPNWSLSVPSEVKAVLNDMATQLAVSLPPAQARTPEQGEPDPVLSCYLSAKNYLKHRKEKLEDSLKWLERTIDDLRKYPGSDGVNLMTRAAEAANQATLYSAAREHAQTLAYLAGDSIDD